MSEAHDRSVEGRITKLEYQMGDQSKVMEQILESMGRLNATVGEMQEGHRERIAVDNALKKAANELADQQQRSNTERNQKMSVWQTNRGFYLALFVAAIGFLVATMQLVTFVTR
jgi:hypothetical protein